MEINVNEIVGAVDASIAAHEAKAAEKLADLEARFSDFETSKLATMPGQHSKGASLSRMLAESESLQALKNRETKSARLTPNLSLKSLVNLGADSSGDDAYPTHPERDPRLGNDPRRPLTLLEALPSLPMNSATYEWASLDGYSNSADEQGAEGVAKPSANVPTELVSVRAATIAHVLKASEQVLQDSPQLVQQISDLLRYGVQNKAESLIVAGDGQIEGLEEVGQAFNAATGATAVDGISAAAAAMDSDGWMADHVVLSPADWHAIRSERSVSDGQYLAGSWAMPADMNIWGLRVITSPAVQAGRPIVLDSRQVAILDRMSPVVELFNQNSDDVEKNLLTLRAEARIAFAVFAPSAVRLVNLV